MFFLEKRPTLSLKFVHLTQMDGIISCRSSHWRRSVKKVILKISQISQACNFIKKRLRHRCFSVKFAKFLRTPILKNISEPLLLKL